MNKILISDFDKTLYCDEESLKINIDEIREFREKGNFFVIATARSYVSLKQKLDQYNIPYDYLILGHGTVILNNKKELILNYHIDNNIVKQITNSMDIFSDKITKIRIFDIYNEDVDIDSKVITKFRMLTETYDDAKKISKYINDNFGKYVKSYAMDAGKYMYAEVISIDTDKSIAIEKLLKYINIEDSNVYTIGDGLNDIEMIEKYNGYGMKISEECIIKSARGLYNNVSDLISDILLNKV